MMETKDYKRRVQPWQNNLEMRDDRYTETVYSGNPVDWENYKKIINKGTTKIRYEKEKYLRNSIDGNKNKPKKIVEKYSKNITR